MHDPKFEKEVQQKMEELSFSPPEAVWLKVEKSLQGEKKRRIFPFWFFLVPALLVMGGVAIYFGISTSHQPSAAITTPSSAASTPVSGASNGVSGTSAAATDAPKPISGGSATPASGNAATATRSAQVYAPASHQNASVRHSLRNTGTTTGKSAISGAHKTGPGIASEPTDDVAAGIPIADASMDGAIAGTPAGKASTPKAPIADAQTGRSSGTPGHIGFATSSHALRAPVFPGLNPIDRHSSAIKGTALKIPGLQASVTKTLLPTPKRPWEPGFEGGFGMSSLNHGILDKSTVMASAYRNYATAITGVPQVYITDIQPDISFWAGVFMEKGLKKDLSLSLGLNLHYYSSRIRTGGKVTASQSSGQSSLLTNIAYSGAPTVQAYPYYAPYGTQTFINRYYFLELPGSVSWQIGHSRKLPLFWQGGITLSYLVSSNSLYFNAKSGVFYKDGSVLNRTQVSLSTGLMMGLPFRGMRIQAGPQLQYGVTNMLNNIQGDGGQHLLYGGIKFVFIPGRSHRDR